MQFIIQHALGSYFYRDATLPANNSYELIVADLTDRTLRILDSGLADYVPVQQESFPFPANIMEYNGVIDVRHEDLPVALQFYYREIILYTDQWPKNYPLRAKKISACVYCHAVFDISNWEFDKLCGYFRVISRWPKTVYTEDSVLDARDPIDVVLNLPRGLPDLENIYCIASPWARSITIHCDAKCMRLMWNANYPNPTVRVTVFTNGKVVNNLGIPIEIKPAKK